MTIEEKRKLCDKDIKISWGGDTSYVGSAYGAKKKFATINIHSTGANFPFAWETVKRAIQNNTALIVN